MLARERRLSDYFDWVSCALSFALMCFSVLFIFSATYSPEQPFSIFFKKQIIGVIAAICIYFLFSILDHRSLLRIGYFAYYGVIVLLIFTLVKGSIGMGAQRWIDFSFFKLQPSELTKLFFAPFAVSYFLEHKDNRYPQFRDIVPLLIILFISCLLIIKQPDLGTGLIILFSGLLIIWCAGIDRRFFIYGTLVCLLTAPILWKVLKPYQRQRISVFFGGGKSNKERYQIEQATIAIGSGTILGKGFLKGTQTSLRFLPEGRTDCIFAVIAEEWGFVGSIIILTLYLLLFLRLFHLIAYIGCPYTQLLALGLLFPILLSALVNIFMVLSMLPIVGVPLPLLSYGLSNLWVTAAALGWIHGIIMQRFAGERYTDRPFSSIAK